MGTLKFLILFFTLNFTLSLATFSYAAEVRDPKQTSEESMPNPILGEKQKYEALQDQDNFNILRHKPIYFAYSHPLTKVQLSFRSALVRDLPLYFGYTQIIFWELEKDSKPFLDATYNPEFFYRVSIDDHQLKSVDIGAWEHNSNGKGGADSRSFDQSYIKGNFAKEFDRWLIAYYAKISYIHGTDDTNSDIQEYIGPLEFQMKFIQLYSGWIDKSEFSFTAHPGGKYGTNWAHGGYEFGYNFRLGGGKAVPAFYVQYFVGYGETLLTYNQREDEFRVGLVF